MAKALGKNRSEVYFVLYSVRYSLAKHPLHGTCIVPSFCQEKNENIVFHRICYSPQRMSGNFIQQLIFGERVAA